ncbi:ketoacyl-ACP synthase III [Roseovarius sp.]|uniref:ketoacyl-ACP synthase III n=1 Tax=Roseovarius sp. TaxID=1486281 RepID=UPI00351363E4
MLGIEAIGSYLPNTKVDNYKAGTRWDLKPDFIESKIGVTERLVKDAEEDTSDMAVKAFEALRQKTGSDLTDIDVLVVVTQNPDHNIPHVAGLVHGKLGLPRSVSTFDVSLGCSGYVYGLNILAGFMQSVGMKRGVLITADPYSKVIDSDDKNTVLLFGDAATATLIGHEPVFEMHSFAGGSQGDLKRALICENGKLEMNGRDIFNFAATSIPGLVEQTLERASLSLDEIDAFLFHQGSGYILDTLARRMKIDPEKVVRGMAHVGNTVSSSIPLLLEAEIDGKRREKLLLCGFGVGLSYASCICQRKD